MSTESKKCRKRKAGHRNWGSGGAKVPGGHRGDFMSAEKRSALMSRIRGKDTQPEQAIASALRKLGYRFQTHAKLLPGRPDIVFTRKRLAVFVDGDFWHGWRFPLWRHKLSPAWQAKIQATRERDRRNFSRLRQLGWTIVRIWEHQVEQDPGRCIDRIVSCLQAGTIL